MTGRWRERLRTLWHKSELDREFDAEAQSHLDLATEDYVQRGLPLPEARRLARLKFGSVAASMDAHRDARGMPWLERILFYWSFDFVAHALNLWIRQALRQKTLTLFLLGSLGISLAGGTFALSLNSAVLWRALPFENAADLLSIQADDNDGQPRWLSWRELESMAGSPVKPFESIAGYTAADFNALSEPGLPPEPVLATLVSPDFFHTLGVRTALGGLPLPETYGASRSRVVLLTHEFWQRRYRSAADIVGRSIRLSQPEYLGGGDESYRVVGVLTSDTWLFWKDIDVVLPMQAEAWRVSNPSLGLFERTLARTFPGTGTVSARSSAPMLLERIKSVGSNRPLASLTLRTLQDAIYKDLAPQLTVILWLAVLVFTLAGVNVMTSTLAQATEQRRGTAIRLAVGASYARLFGETLYQHIITVSIAALLGVGLAQWLLAGIGAQMPDDWLSRIPGQLTALRIDANVLWWAATALAATVFVSSSAIQVITRRLKPWSLLASAQTDDTQRAGVWRSALVGLEIALCSAVVITTVTLATQLVSLRSTPMGVDSTRTSALWVNLGSASLADRAARIAYYDRILQSSQSAPGIEAVGGISHPFTLGWGSVQFNDSASRALPDTPALARSATPAYLDASGIRLIEGRWFINHDGVNAPGVAVLSESLAKVRWPGQSAIGREVATIDAEGARLVSTVIGVVADTRHAQHQPADRIVYRPVAQDPPPWLYLIIRARPGAGDAARAVSEAIWRINPDQPIDGPWSISEWIDKRTTHLRFLTMIAVTLGAVSLVLAVAGIYALTAWSVASSSRSIAVRRAVGASNEQIAWWCLARWTPVVFSGLIGGWILQSSWMSALVATIEGLHAPPPSVVLLGTVLMGAAAASAAFVPLRRALRGDSSSLLR